MVHNQQVYTNKCNDKRNCWIIWISLEDKYMKEKGTWDLEFMQYNL